MNTPATKAKWLRITAAQSIVALITAASIAQAQTNPTQITTPKPADATTTQTDEHASHSHKPVRGGHLVELGDHAASLEFVLHAPTGKLDMYIGQCDPLDPIRIKQTSIELGLTKANGKDLQTTVTLKPVANIATGDTVGDTSQFSVTTNELKNAKNFAANIGEITIKGASFKNIQFQTTTLPTTPNP